MPYACLVYIDPTTAFDGSPENTAVLEEAAMHRRELNQRGIPNEALTLPHEAVTVRVRKKKLSRTDGPFMESKEMLAGFVLIEAASMDDAVAIAATNPMAKLGAVEVRPLVDFSQPRPVL